MYACVGSLAFETRHTNKLSKKTLHQIKAKGLGLSYLLKNLIHNHWVNLLQTLTALDLCITFWGINATTQLAFIEQSFGFLYKSVFNEPWKRWLLNNSLPHSSSTASNYIVYNYIIVQYNVCPTIPEFYYCTTLWHQRKSPFHFHSQPLSLCLVSQHKCTQNCTFDCWMHQTSLPASAEIRK